MLEEDFLINKIPLNWDAVFKEIAFENTPFSLFKGVKMETIRYLEVNEFEKKKKFII